jgi:hypothetical protein
VSGLGLSGLGLWVWLRSCPGLRLGSGLVLLSGLVLMFEPLGIEFSRRGVISL